MFEELLIDQNKHWQNKLENNYVQRDQLKSIEDRLSLKQILVITGIRRSGKSTLLKETINYLVKEKKINPKQILSLNLESPYLYNYREDPKNLDLLYREFIAINKLEEEDQKYILLDEIQFFKDWQVFVKSRYETDNIKFIITGSNAQLLSSEFTTLLSGRTLELMILPFNLQEVLIAKNIKHGNRMYNVTNRDTIQQEFNNYLYEGGFPEVVLNNEKEKNKEILYEYYQNILIKDVMPRFNIKENANLEKLALYLATNVSNPYSYNNLKDLLNISDKTVKEYIKYLEKAYLFFEIERFDYSIKTQAKNPKKIYGIDNGLLNAISVKFSKNEGRLLENLTYIVLRKDSNSKTYYYKTKNNLEIDFLTTKNNNVDKLIQVCSDLDDNKTKERELKALLTASEELRCNSLYILTKEHEEIITKDKKKIYIMPLWKFILTENNQD